MPSFTPPAANAVDFALVTFTAPGSTAVDFDLGAAAATCAVTGTLAAAGITQADVVAGGDTIILTLTGDTWVASGATFDAQRQAIIDGLDAASSPAGGWNAEVRDTLAVTTVARTSDTVVTVTLPAIPDYTIAVAEVVTVTVPGAAVTGASPITATPTITILAGALITTPMGPSNGSGVVPTGTLTSDVPLSGTNGAYLELAWATSRGTLYGFSLPLVP